MTFFTEFMTRQITFFTKLAICQITFCTKFKNFIAKLTKPNLPGLTLQGVLPGPKPVLKPIQGRRAKPETRSWLISPAGLGP